MITSFFYGIILHERIITMEKNYYEILEVDKNASSEIIDKAYKTLAKKYHPDLQNDANKKESEELFKQINEAYETLSDPTSRHLYDEKLNTTIISLEQYDTLYKQNQLLKRQVTELQSYLNQLNTYINNTNQNDNTISEETYHKTSNSYSEPYIRPNKKRNIQSQNNSYSNQYAQDFDDDSYTVEYRKSFRDYLKGFISILIVIFILFVLWHIPFIHNYFVEFYENNEILQYIGNTLSNMFH